MGTQFLSISNGKIDPELVLGIQRDFSLDPAERNHSHDDHNHVEVVSRNIRLEGSINRDALEILLKDLAVQYQIIRLKGRCWFPGKSIPLQIQMVGPRLSSWYEVAPTSSWRPSESGVDFVLIGFDEVKWIWPLA